MNGGSRNTSLAWVALAVGLLGFAVTLVAVVVHHLPRTPCLIVAGLAVFGAVAIAAFHGRKLPREVRRHMRAAGRRLPWRRPGRGEFDYEQHEANPRLLSQAVRAGKASVGEGHPSVETLKQRIGVNPEVILLYGRRYHADERFEPCGYGLIYPLTDKAGKAIAKGRIRSGSELEPKHLRRDFAEARHLYVGMILATDREAAPHVKAMLRMELSRRLEGSRVEQIFGKPASRPGRKMLRDYGFTPILPDEDGIWGVSREQLIGNLRSRSGRALG